MKFICQIRIRFATTTTMSEINMRNGIFMRPERDERSPVVVGTICPAGNPNDDDDGNIGDSQGYAGIN